MNDKETKNIKFCDFDFENLVKNSDCEHVFFNLFFKVKNKKGFFHTKEAAHNYSLDQIISSEYFEKYKNFTLQSYRSVSINHFNTSEYSFNRLSAFDSVCNYDLFFVEN